MGEYRVSTGRGGAGNVITSHEKPAPKVVAQGSPVPNIISPVYSTGRGGAGNMRRNVDPVITRTAQDVDDGDEDIIDVISSNKSGGIQKVKSRRHSDVPKNVSIGRGGAGNMLSPKTSSKKVKKQGQPQPQPQAHGSDDLHRSKSGLFTKLKSIFK